MRHDKSPRWVYPANRKSPGAPGYPRRIPLEVYTTSIWQCSVRALARLATGDAAPRAARPTLTASPGREPRSQTPRAGTF